MYEDGVSAATKYLSSIMMPDDVLFLKILVSHFHRAPSTARRYLQAHCRDVYGLENFLKEKSHLFFVENKRVALSDDKLGKARVSAAEYFKEKLSEYDDAVHYMEFKEQQLSSAPEDVIDFIVRFYPAGEFKKFFTSRPDIFVTYQDDTIFLIELETVSYFERRLEFFASNRYLHFMKLRGHIAQAPLHVQFYINTYFQGQDFQYFLRNNDNVFMIRDDGLVSLVEND